jgi:TetR/AcrR family transcriptional repressor of nem operon
MQKNSPPPTPQPRQKISHKERAVQRRDTRDALIRCGTEMCTERGFQLSGINEILERVGAPKGSFYHFFSSKEEFGEAVIENYAVYFQRKLDRLFSDTSRAPLQRLADFVDEAQKGMARFDFQRGCLVGNLGQELGGLNENFRKRLEAVLLDWEYRTAQCLREAVAAGELDPASDADALAKFFWIGWEGAILRTKLTRTTEPMRLFADMFFEKVLR